MRSLFKKLLGNQSTSKGGNKAQQSLRNILNARFSQSNSSHYQSNNASFSGGILGIAVTITLFGMTVYAFEQQERNVMRDAYQRNLVDLVTRGSSMLAQAEEARKIIDAFFRQSVNMIPHFEKRHKGGEDAYVSNERLIVVADGVGGWSEVGVDPGLFSKQLVKDIEAQFNKNPKGSLKEMLVEAVKVNKHIGSSTAVLATMDVTDGSVVLRTTNLGDSGYVIFRAPSLGSQSQEKLEVYFRSKEQQYSFNFPYQCGTDCELPYKAFDQTHKLEDRDIIVMGSDGMFDNLYHEDMLACIYPQYQVGTNRYQTGELKSTDAIAECIAKKSEEKSYQQFYMSPFARGAQEAGIAYRGGKADDITVIVAQVNFKYQ